MALEPTAEQQAATEVFVAGRDLALVAGAGSGRSSTLIPMGASTRKRGLYMALNKKIATDASSASPVTCPSALTASHSPTRLASLIEARHSGPAV
ncbi:hypothetical protein ABT158_07040 [Nonomuraea sp. NPDC001636]|uniref:hypothetical protein n=1 Tax=Nonomuraea sp. NPDC001636 TaxID=3154391 RepID=UPI00332E834C